MKFNHTYLIVWLTTMLLWILGLIIINILNLTQYITLWLLICLLFEIILFILFKLKMENKYKTEMLG